MQTSIFDGLALVDTTGRLILGSTVAALATAVAAHVLLRSKYSAVQRDLERNGEPRPHFSSPLLRRVVHDVETAARTSGEPNVQGIIEDAFRAELGPQLLAERFVRAATGLVLILGLLGTFYGLTLSIGKLVHLVGADNVATQDVALAVTNGLTQALGGMAVAFSNSLLGVGSAVVLSVIGVVNNPTDRRTSLMIQIETYVDRLLATFPAVRKDPGGAVGAFGDSVARLEGAVARFESALQGFAASTKDLREVQLVVSLKPGDGR